MTPRALELLGNAGHIVEQELAAHPIDTDDIAWVKAHRTAEILAEALAETERTISTGFIRRDPHGRTPPDASK